MYANMPRTAPVQWGPRFPFRRGGLGTAAAIWLPLYGCRFPLDVRAARGVVMTATSWASATARTPACLKATRGALGRPPRKGDTMTPKRGLQRMLSLAILIAVFVVGCAAS